MKRLILVVVLVGALGSLAFAAFPTSVNNSWGEIKQPLPNVALLPPPEGLGELV